MTDEDLKKIGELIDSKLEPLKEDVSGIKKTLKDHTEKLDAISGDTEQLLGDVKGIRDEIGLWHQRDKREINEIKKHLNLPVIPDRPEI